MSETFMNENPWVDLKSVDNFLYDVKYRIQRGI